MNRIIVVILLSVSLLALSLDKRDWKVRYSQNIKLNNPWSFIFPLAPGHVNYITTSYKTPINQSQSVTISVKIEGNPSFDYGLGENGNNCVNPAHVRAYFEQTYKKDITYAPCNYRWWSNPISIELAPGEFSVTTPFIPSQWSNTCGEFGNDQLDGFNQAMSHPQAVGMTFGGGCFFGHGVSVSNGSARFTLKEFIIQ